MYLVCAWASGQVQSGGSGDDTVHVYPIEKWDGVTPEDDSAADAEVTAQERSKAQSSNDEDKPKDNPELPPGDDDGQGE